MSKRPPAEFRKQLRKSLTPAEASLWRCLKGKQLAGRKFRRQHSIGPYVVDFFCPSERLIIELDGAHHLSGPGSEYDEVRDQYLNSLGYTVLRYENKVWFANQESVLADICAHFKDCPAS